MPEAVNVPNKEDLLTALKRVQEYAHKTPVLSCSGINKIVGAELFFKCENFQKIGAFKFRGGINTIFQLSEDEMQKGVATHSSGNHGQAVALAAKMRNIPAYIVMPQNSTKVKIEAVRSYGAELIFCDNSLQAREDKLNEIISETGAHFVHPYDDYRVIAGQSTSAQELIQDYPKLDIIITPIGGGGLISGTALAAKYFSPRTEVIGSEPEGADSAAISLQKHRWTTIADPNTICDGLRASIGEKNFDIISKNVSTVFRVSDREAISAMKLIWERMKIVIEPSCAVPLAAIIKNKDRFKNKRVGLILTGGNVDLNSISELFKEI
ncbi:MAG: pyridoxal-phosphate dependent enzyme [Cytophagales bacterium]